MNIKTLILVLLIPTGLFSQGKNLFNFEGNWIKYKIEMNDGSNLIDRFLTDSAYVKYSFRKNILCINGNPVHKVNQSCLKYNLYDNFIKTSKTSGYVIEEIKKDTLIISEKIDGLENDKLKRFYFVKEETLFNKIRNKQKEQPNQIANEFYTPTLKSSLALKLNNSFKNKHSNFRLKGRIVFDIRNKKINTIILSCTTSDSSKIKRIKRTINRSYKLWNLEKFSKLNSIEIPFVLKDTKTKTSWGISMRFFTQSFYKLDHVQGGRLDQNRKASQYFLKAIDAYKNKNLSLAISYFSKSYELDPIHIDALYNRAAIYYQIGEKELACNDWETLSNLGQKKGIVLLKTHCKRTNQR